MIGPHVHMGPIKTESVVFSPPLKISSKSIGEGLFGENGGLEQILQSMIHQAKDFLVMPDLDLASA